MWQVSTFQEDGNLCVAQELNKSEVIQKDKEDVAVKEVEQSERVEVTKEGLEKQVEERVKQDGEGLPFTTDTTASIAEGSEHCAEHADTSSKLIVGMTHQSGIDESVIVSGVEKQGGVAVRSNIVDEPPNTMSEMAKKHANRSCTIL